MGETRRIAIVTGASRKVGIGSAICRALAQDGVDLLITYWTKYDASMPWGTVQQEQADLVQELRDMGVRAESLELDLADPAAAQVLFDECETRLGTASILVNNACYSLNDGYEHVTAELLDRHYEINLRATTLLSCEFAKRFTLGGGGRIINMTSGQSGGKMTGELAYAITKGAVETLTKNLANAISHLGITVNAINPGPTDTGWMNEELRRDLLPLFPLGRIGQADDAARLARFLASEDGGWVTGQIIHSHGGFRE